MNILQDIQKYFTIDELVCPHIYNRDRNIAYNYLDKDLLKVLLFIRTKLGKPIIINNYKSLGSYSQRGIRCNCCDLVKDKTLKNVLYYSTHMQGKAIDFDVKGLSAEEVRKWLKQHETEIPHPIRLEEKVNWIHIDTRVTNNKKIETFID